MLNKRLINTGVEAAPAVFDPLQNFETVTYTGNGSTQKITGYIRKGAAFNGSSSIINLPNGSFQYTTFSVSAWVFPTVAQNSVILNTYDYIGVSKGFLFRMDSARTIRFNSYANDSGNYNDIVTTDTIPLNDWSHVCVTYAAGGSIYIYINGVEKASQTVNSTPVDYHAQGVVQIGAADYSTADPIEQQLNGKIDQVRIFNTALNPTKVGQLALETYADPKKSTTDYFGNGSGVALYELDEDAGDTGVPIDSGQSAVFNGANSRINLPNNPINGKTNISTTFWLNPNDISRYQYVLSFVNQIGGWNGFGVRVSNTGKINIIRAKNGTVTSSENSSHTLVLNTWVHVGITSTQSQLLIYINGALDSTHSILGFTTNNTGSFDIGMNEYDTGVTQAFTDGIIDEVRIYDDILDLSEIVAIYNENNPTTGNLVAHYKLDGNANDETTNYNGTWGGTEAYSDPAVTAYNGTPTNVNFLGMAFQPDFVWIKDRDAAEQHGLFDSVRGADLWLHSETTQAENNYGGGYGVTSFDLNGFSIGNGTAINRLNDNYVAWCWKAGGSVTPNNNTDGDITSTVSANQDAGFSIATWSGDDTASNIGHGLGGSPELMIIKNRTGTNSWIVGVPDVLGTGYLILNDSGQASTSNVFGQVPDSTRYYFNTAAGGNGHLSTGNYVGYFFRSIDGYQKVGSYTGTGATGNSIVTGFEPAFLLVKRTDSGDNWLVFDNKRNTTNPTNLSLKPNSSAAESVGNLGNGFDFLSNGFQVVSTDSGVNANGGTYIYLAIA